MWESYNPNPFGANVGDCAVRAVAMALGVSWAEAYLGITAEGLLMGDMPSANRVWGSYLKRNGFLRRSLPEDCGFTLEKFCRANPRGIFVVALENHVVCVADGRFYDSWDSSNEIPIYYWKKSERK